MVDGLKKNDPYNAVSESEKSDIKPGFLGGSGGGDKPSGYSGKTAKKEEKAKQARNELGDVEDNAVAVGQNEEGGFYRGSDSIDKTRENEEGAGGFYSVGKISKKGDKKSKFSLKKRGPLFALILGLFGVGGIMSGAQMFQPFSLVAQFRETYNSMHTSANLRSARFFNMQMKTRKTKSPYNLFGTDFKISPKQASKLSAQGIEYVEDYKGERVFKFTEEDGTLKIITTDADAARRIGDGAVDFKTYYADNPIFFEKYNAGSMTWRGAIANWFGSSTDSFIKNNNLSRNTFDDYDKKVAANGGDGETTVREMLARKTEEIEGGGFKSDNRIEKEEVDEDGNRIYPPADTNNIKPDEYSGYIGSRESGTDATVSDDYGKISRNNIDVNAKLNQISGSVQKGANIACTIGNVIGAVSALVTAAEALQIINLTTAYFETVDKVKAGDGKDAPIHELTNALNAKQKNENATLVFKGSYDESSLEQYDSENNIEKIRNNASDSVLQTEYYTTEKTAMQSSGIAALYGGGPVNSNDPSVQSFNFTNSIKRILGGIGVSMTGFKSCAIAKITANLVSAATDAASIFACVLGVAGAAFTAGASLGACSGLVVKIAKSIAMSVAIGITVAAVISAITPMVSSALTRDLVSNLGGEDLGNALASGGNMFLGSTHRANGGSLATKEEYVDFAMEQQSVIAENAKYERSTLSPFDITSKNTFMGALLTKMMSFLTVDSLMSTVTSSSSIVSSSIVALSPTVSAYNVAEDLPDMKKYEETCPYLASIDAVGDAYCNPYVITDVSTIDMDPEDVVMKLDEMGNFEEGATSDGNVKIKANSKLAKHIVNCDNRQSPFGIVDQNIANNVMNWMDVRTGSLTFNAAANSAIGAVPVLGDVVDIVNNEKAVANIGYIGGGSCVAGNTVGDENLLFSESPNWKGEGNLYQRFTEDQALLESMGLIKESAVTAFLDEYYKENPLDNSYEGILARKSGLSKDAVVAILDLVDYGNYIANYDPTERYAFGAPVVETKEELRFDNENTLSGDVVLINAISFADVRNRNFAV